MFAESLVNMFVAIFRALVHFSVCVSMCEYVFTIVHMCLSVFTLQTFLSVCVCPHFCGHRSIFVQHFFTACMFNNFHMLPQSARTTVILVHCPSLAVPGTLNFPGV